jgi:hypothetical protein
MYVCARSVELYDERGFAMSLRLVGTEWTPLWAVLIVARPAGDRTARDPRFERLARCDRDELQMLLRAADSWGAFRTDSRRRRRRAAHELAWLSLLFDDVDGFAWAFQAQLREADWHGRFGALFGRVEVKAPAQLPAGSSPLSVPFDVLAASLQSAFRPSHRVVALDFVVIGARVYLARAVGYRVAIRFESMPRLHEHVQRRIQQRRLHALTWWASVVPPKPSL